MKSAALISCCLLSVCCGRIISDDFTNSQFADGKPTTPEEKKLYRKEFFLTPEPPTIELDEIELDQKNHNATESYLFVGREVFNFSDVTYDETFAKDERFPPEEHKIFSLPYNTGGQSRREWGSWTCCRRRVNVQSRERISFTGRIELDYRKCMINYCHEYECKEDARVCKTIITLAKGDICDPSNGLANYMSHHCPKTCNFCGGATTLGISQKRTLVHSPKRDRTISTTKATTTALPWWRVLAGRTTQRTVPWRIPTTSPTTLPPMTQYTMPRTSRATRPFNKPSWRPKPTAATQESAVVKITILQHNLNPNIPSYKFVSGDYVDVRPPWKRIVESPTKLSSFNLYKVPSGIFQMAIAFCSGTDSLGIEKWKVVKNQCKPGWNQRYLLYGSTQRSKSTVMYLVGSRDAPSSSSEISKQFPSAPFRSGIFFFYAPNPQMGSIRTTTKSYIRTRPTPPTSSIATNPPRYAPHVPDYPRIPSTPTQHMNSFNRECLEAHNFFRAVHNVPPLRWSAKLTQSAQKWADELKRIAPHRPSSLKYPSLKTSNWPHSEAGSKFRSAGDGENIAWDLSADGSSAKESILRFYSEIFYYNRKHPTYSPSRERPVGHVTQLLWKDTTEVGCGTAKGRSGRFNSQSTWTVVHYSPGGNRRYRTSGKKTLELYNVQVPDMRSGSCMTKSGSCNRGNQCMAFGPANGKCFCNSGTPECSSVNGCIAWCDNKWEKWHWKEECQGKYECKCTITGAVCK